MSYVIKVYDKWWKSVRDFEFDATRFAAEKINPSLIHEYLLYQQSNARKAIASTKTRGEVAGSGRKLYRQKGTGRARVGDKNSPIRRGGWVAFGPSSERNFEKSMNKKMRSLALDSTISAKLDDNAVLGLELTTMEAKTKDAIAVLSALSLQEKKILLVLGEKNEGIEKSFRNIEGVKLLLVDYLNPYDLLHADSVVFFDSALQKFTK